MANHRGIYSFSQSLAEFLDQKFAVFKADPENASVPTVTFEALGTTDFNTAETKVENKITLYLHRITPNNQLRNVRAAQPIGTIGLDLHYLVTVWAENMMDEQVLMGWVLRELHSHSFLDRSSLTDDADWAVDETISIVPVDFNSEEMARIWDMARRGYRLSYPFLARIIRLTPAPSEETPVVASRFSHTDNLSSREP